MRDPPSHLCTRIHHFLPLQEHFPKYLPVSLCHLFLPLMPSLTYWHALEQGIFDATRSSNSWITFATNSFSWCSILFDHSDSVPINPLKQSYIHTTVIQTEQVIFRNTHTYIHVCMKQIMKKEHEQEGLWREQGGVYERVWRADKEGRNDVVIL